MPLDFNIHERDGRDPKNEFIEGMKICISPEATDEEKKKGEKKVMTTIYLTMDIVKNIIPVGIQLDELISWIKENTDIDGYERFKIYLQNLRNRVDVILGDTKDSINSHTEGTIKNEEDYIIALVKTQIAVIIAFLEYF